MSPMDKLLKAMRDRSARRQEWDCVTPTGCERATSIALLHLGVAYTCDGPCHLTYYGGPRRVALATGPDGPVALLYCSRCHPPSPAR